MTVVVHSMYIATPIPKDGYNDPVIGTRINKNKNNKSGGILQKKKKKRRRCMRIRWFYNINKSSIGSFRA